MDSPTHKDTERNQITPLDDEAPNAYKVAIPPKQNLFKEFKYTVKETLFADDPLRSFKDQTKSRKFILCIEAIFPIFSWGRGYNLKKFRGDIIAGLTIASLCIPQVNFLYDDANTQLWFIFYVLIVLGLKNRILDTRSLRIWLRSMDCVRVLS